MYLCCTRFINVFKYPLDLGKYRSSWSSLIELFYFTNAASYAGFSCDDSVQFV